MEPQDLATLEAGLDDVRRSPRDRGRVELIVARPGPDERVVLEVAALDPEAGLVGDSWRTRGSRRTADGSANVLMQLTLMNARVAALLAGAKERWSLAGDQLYVDLDLSGEHLPAGTRLEMGTAVIEITDQPHTGCAKFAQRYGPDATRFVNSPEGRALNLRGVNARVVTEGVVRAGDEIRVLADPH